MTEFLNSLKRRILIGPRGGFYSISDKGRKMYGIKAHFHSSGRKLLETNNVPTIIRFRPKAAPLKTPIKKALKLRLKLVQNRLKTLNKNKSKFLGTKRSFILPRFDKKRVETTKSIKYTSYNSRNIITNSDKSINQEWMYKQSNYIKNLSDYDFRTLSCYTVRSYGWLTPFMRFGTLPKRISSYKSAFSGHPAMETPLLAQLEKLGGRALADVTKNDKLHRDALQLYVKDLHRIIQKAPPVPETMYLYRGTTTDVFHGKIGAIQHLGPFASGSYLLNTALEYGKIIQRIKILKGTHVILASAVNRWKASGENEVIINNDSRYIIRARDIKRKIMTDKNNIVARVTDITLLS